MSLRPYQADAVQRVRDAFRTVRSVVLQLPTGAGKTHIAADLIRMSTDKGNRVVFCAHRDDLIGDTLDRLSALGLRAGRIQATERADPDAPIQVCSLQTLHARGEVPEASFVILDECHRAPAPSVFGILERWKSARILGLTATPCRSDGAALGACFDRLVVGPSVKQLIMAGVLVRPIVYAPPRFQPDLAKDIAEQVRETAGQTVVFTANLTDARRVESEVESARIVHGEQPFDERRAVLSGFDRAEFRVLVNCMVLTEGWNCPRVENLVLARACSHVGSYLQIVGRVLRTFPGKVAARVYDLCGCVHKYGTPDADRTFSLDGIPIRAKKQQIRQCPKCGSVFEPAPTCPQCGYEFPPPLAKSVARSDMGEYKQKFLNLTPEEHFRLMREDGESRGWKPIAARIRFKQIYGYWPQW